MLENNGELNKGVISTQFLHPSLFYKFWSQATIFFFIDQNMISQNTMMTPKYDVDVNVRWSALKSGDLVYAWKQIHGLITDL